MTESGDDTASAEPIARMATAVGWIACFLLPPVAFRIALLAGVGGLETSLDVRGFASDAVAALLGATGAIALARVHRALAAFLIGLWVVVCSGNTEHVLANGANVLAAHAGFLGDATFVLGSALRPTSPGTLLSVTLLTAGLAAWTLRRRGPLPPLGPAAAVAVASAIGLAIWPIALAAPEWRQAGPIESNWRPGPDRPEDATHRADTAGGPRRRREMADLGGEPILPRGGRDMNVLIVLVEGISGAHLPTIAAANEVQSDLALPGLDALARRHVHYTSFVAQQRQTNRGEYALLCGDWPKLWTDLPRMSELVGGGAPRCLPEALSDLGYETVYLQAAPLGFMMKDQFMERIGFDRVLGNAWFPSARSRTTWGVDDATLFDGALEEIRRLEDGSRPWMMTLLTVGTHHPYNVPTNFDAGEDVGFARAARFADEAVADFIRALEADGVLDRTLVLITTDESRGLPDGAAGKPVSLLLSRNWAFLIGLVPGAAAVRIDEPFLQSDLALSVLDFLDAGPAAEAGGGGRSVFRRYATPRRLAFGNTYQQRIITVDPDGAIDVCREDFSVCSRFSGVAGRPFHAEVTPERDLTPEERSARAAWVFGDERDRTNQPTRIAVDLIGDTPVPVLTGPVRNQLVFAGQGLAAPPGVTIEVELEVGLRGARGHATLRTNLTAADRNEPIHVDALRLTAGDRASLHYSVDVGAPLRDLEARVVVVDRTGEDLELVFERARLTITEGGDAPPGPHRVRVMRREVVTAAETERDPRG